MNNEYVQTMLVLNTFNMTMNLNIKYRVYRANKVKSSLSLRTNSKNKKIITAEQIKILKIALRKKKTRLRSTTYSVPAYSPNVARV